MIKFDFVESFGPLSCSCALFYWGHIVLLAPFYLLVHIGNQIQKYDYVIFIIALHQRFNKKEYPFLILQTNNYFSCDLNRLSLPSYFEQSLLYAKSKYVILCHKKRTQTNFLKHLNKAWNTLGFLSCFFIILVFSKL